MEITRRKFITITTAASAAAATLLQSEGEPARDENVQEKTAKIP